MGTFPKQISYQECLLIFQNFQISDLFEKVRDGNMQGILDTSTESLVSMDYMNNPFSVTIDQSLTSVSGGMGKVFGWFDNESGYAHRIKDFLLKHG